MASSWDGGFNMQKKKTVKPAVAKRKSKKKGRNVAWSFPAVDSTLVYLYIAKVWYSNSHRRWVADCRDGKDMPLFDTQAEACEYCYKNLKIKPQGKAAT